MSTVIIVNPIAGGVSRSLAATRVAMASRAVDRDGKPVTVFVTECAGHARELARSSLSNGADRIVAWGGDGTINEVASALITDPAATLGVVPAGSGNGLARVLELPTHPAHALSIALSAPAKPIDAGELGGRLFVNVAGIGFDAHVASKFNARDNRVRGLTGYVLITATELMTYRTCRYTMATANASWSVRALLIVLANGIEFGNRIAIAPRARVDDGALDLVTVVEESRWTTLLNLRRLLTGSIELAPIWSARRIDEITITATAPMLFHVDGEPVQGGTTLHARIHPGALRIACGSG